jgi:hypothetical protein
MRHIITILALTALLHSSFSCAQEATQQHQPGPEDMQKIMDATFGAMVPMMAKMTEVMIEAQLRIAIIPDTADRIATFKKNLYDSLVKRGFTADQAMQIVVATSVPSATPAMK